MTDIASMEEASAFDKLSLLLVGVEGSGKSWLGATGRKPVYVLDYDRRKSALAGKKGVYATTLIDPTWPMQPVAYQQTLNILGELEQGKLLFKGEKPRTLMFDSIATFARSASLYAMYSSPDIRRTIKISGMEIHAPLRDGFTSEMSMVEGAILRALAIPNLDVICTLHEVAEEAPESTDAKPSYTGRFGIYPVRYKLLLKWFNEVWRVERTAKVPTVQILPSWQFTAKSNLGIDAMTVPDIAQAIAQKWPNSK